MPAFVLVRRDSYHDSVLLMRVSQALKALPGVEDAVVAMGTPHNRELLAAQGYGGAALSGATPNDLVIAVRGEGGAPAAVEAELERLLEGAGSRRGRRGDAAGLGRGGAARAPGRRPRARSPCRASTRPARRAARWRWAGTSCSSPTTCRWPTRSP